MVLTRRENLFSAFQKYLGVKRTSAERAAPPSTHRPNFSYALLSAQADHHIDRRNLHPFGVAAGIG